MTSIGDDGQQPRDQWGGPLQGEYGRVLGRIESSQHDLSEKLREMKAEIRENSKSRDKAFAEITERVRANAHKANNDLQGLSNRVEGLDGKVVNVGVSVDTANKRMEQQAVQLASIDQRVGKLEEPVNEAIALRERRRARLKRWWMWAAAVLVFLWGGFEPVYKTLMPVAVQRWFSLNLPPH